MSDAFEIAWTLVKNEEKEEKSKKKKSKSKFKGYSKNRISGRAERQGKARAWSQSRKVKRKRTRMRYARNKTRGNVRPKLRRQLGAGGERIQVKKAPEWEGETSRSRFGRGGERLKQGGRQVKPRYCIREGCNRKLSSSISMRPGLQQCGTCLRLYGHKGLDVYADYSGSSKHNREKPPQPDVDPGDVAPT